MKRSIFFVLGLIVVLLLIYAAPEIPYGTGKWDAEQLGNHRIVIRVDQGVDAVFVHIPWRRRDPDPEQKKVILIDAETNERIFNIFRVTINREYGAFVFQPKTVPGKYYLYYLPNVMTGRSNYPTVIYPEPENTVDLDWIQQNGLDKKSAEINLQKKFPHADVIEIQSIDAFNSFFPMEIIAAAAEVEGLLSQNPAMSYLLFPENRKHPIRMAEDLPLRWIRSGAGGPFHGEALRGEYYSFQIGLYACRADIADVDIKFSELENQNKGIKIPAAHFTCFNTGGIDWTGKKFDRVCPVKKGHIQALWCGVQIPEQAVPGTYKATLWIKPKHMDPQEIEFNVTVLDEVISDAGDAEPWRHSRLRWLNSLLAFDDGIVSPFIPVKVSGRKVSCLGREMILNDMGLPQSILSYFAPEMTFLSKTGRQILAAPIDLVVESDENGIIAWQKGKIALEKKAEGIVIWSSKSTSGPLSLECRAGLEFDGCVEYEISLHSSTPLKVKDIRLEIPLLRDVAKYMMGMGIKGGMRPQESHWRWDQKKNQDSAWVGDVNAGLQISLKDINYSRPLNTNFYLLKPLNMPPSWFNDGKGGCSFIEKDKNIFLISAFSGERILKPDEILHFNFRLLLTPFKLLDTAGQWGTRYFHRFDPVDEIKASGANTINVHHATEINPFINYPFLRPAEMKAYIDDGHSKGMKVKIYYTVRELSNRAPEIFALRSLGDEILSYGPGGGFSWLQEHLVSDYIAAWFVPDLKDAAIINSGVSRWHNYYVEGLNWLVKNVGIDGLYIDDVAFDRITMKRVRKILDRGRPDALIDLHSANQFNVRDGFANSANLYLEHFPYINRLWFGEYFDYKASPDFWMVEMAGIPFGVMGEMLQDGGNPWRGMVFGMTSRLPWAGDPTPLWKFWDDFEIQEARMIGFWVPDSPVKTSRDDVLATVFIKKKEILIALASWAEDEVKVKIIVDWERLGLVPEKCRLSAYPIRDFQAAASFDPAGKIAVKPGEGWLLILSQDGS
ncbi:MAG: hypothetical protein JW755_12875 [Candidatus Aminicenantes bacterium]|nr:hypothetical protein [Candidatus Aminicenantes bacterium]